jgi:hypothetical protein
MDDPGWLRVAFTLVAATAQTSRNAIQRPFCRPQRGSPMASGCRCDQELREFMFDAQS